MTEPRISPSEAQPRNAERPSSANASCPNNWAASLAVATTLALLQRHLQTLFDGASELRHFFDRAIGMTTLAGVDASGYASNFIRLQALLAATFLICFGAALLLRRWLDRRTTPQVPEHRWIARLAELWIALAVFDIFFPQAGARSLEVLLAHFVALGFVVLVLRTSPFVCRRWPLLDADRHFVLGSLFWPLPFFFAVWTVGGRSAGFQGAPITLWFLLFVLVWLMLLLLVRNADSATRGRFMTAAVPWLLVPAALPMANEIQAKLRYADPRHVALVLISLLAVATVAVYWRLRSVLPSPRRLLHRVYFPLTVFSCAVLKSHRHRRFMGELDYFHLGEQTLPTHQLFNFSKLPLLDIRLSHTFSDLIYPWLYSVIHGVQGLDMLVWILDLERIVGVLLCYFVLARVFSPGYAFVASLLLPVLGTIGSYYVLALLPAIFLGRALQRPTTGRFVALWLSLLALALWRIDFGMVAAVALLGVLGVHLLHGRHRRRALWQSLVWLGGAGGALLLGVLLIKGPTAFATLSLFFDSYSYRLITRTRPEVIREFTSAAAVQYYLVPAVCLVYIVYLAAQRLLLRRHVPKHKLLLTFLATFSLVMSVRSMERHSLIESFNPYLAMLLLALLPVLFSRTVQAKERRTTRGVFAATFVLYSLFVLPPTTRSYANPSSIALNLPQPLFSFYRFAEGESRVVFDTRRHRELLDFLDRSLQPGETFFDFTNSPLLYVLADREFPVYYIPNLIQTAETIQADVLEDLSTLREAGRMPLVIFKQGNLYWDGTDGVPNEIRSYRVAEWIYRHYRPAAQVGKYQIWWQRDRQALWSSPTSIVDYELPRRDSEHLYGVTATPFGDSSVRLQTTGPDAHAFSLFDASRLPPLESQAAWTLDLTMSWTGDQPVQLFFGFDGRYFRAESTAWVLPEDIEDGHAQLQLMWPAQAQRLTDIRFDPPPNSSLTIGDVHLRGRSKVQRPLNEIDLQQHFDLGHLPGIWARYDPLDARSATAQLATLLDTPVRLAAGDSLDLKIPPLDNADTHGSYLHLQIRPLSALRIDEPDVTLAYRGASGGEVESTFAFDLTTFGGDKLSLMRNSEAQLEDLRIYPSGNRWVLRALADAPVLYRPFDPHGLPEFEPQAELFLHIAYRSRNEGSLEVCLRCDSLPDGGRELHSVAFRITSDHGAPATLSLPLPPVAEMEADRRDQLGELGLRFSFDRTASGADPLFEIVEAHIVQTPDGWRDYLVRLSTQWRWWQDDVDRLELRANRPMIVDRVVLRGGD